MMNEETQNDEEEDTEEEEEQQQEDKTKSRKRQGWSKTEFAETQEGIVHKRTSKLIQKKISNMKSKKRFLEIESLGPGCEDIK